VSETTRDETTEAMQRVMRRVGERADALVERMAADDQRRRERRQAEKLSRDDSGRSDDTMAGQ
jgi:DNA gyrase/topoisomerase IV subunit B